ncbi:putative ATPase YjoB [Mycobacterium marinum]|uniref:Putative ATPase YjoB n=1 Tax=Mycobacterium marinum TaxID=1781 RepID=A0A3E2MW70_MYCMR|nr:AAA family ATPase [Mycobacterium marinum]RFZ41379.1 putative ATPase YjoB [Mycobacterium marinum]
MSSETAAVNFSGNASDLIATMRDRAPRIAMAIAAAQLAWPAAKTLHHKHFEHTRYTVKVPGTDDIYDELHEWVLGLLPARQQRALVAWTSKRNNSDMAVLGESGKTPPPRVRLRYDGSREQTITINGHKIRVVVTDSEPSGKEDRFKPPEIIFTATSLEAQQHLLHQISQVARRSHEHARKPVFRMLNKWGDWERLDDLPARDLDSVILPPGQLERLTDDVSRFLAAEHDYLRRCIPWHRGHLYEGPPGTGKTSVARAIASHFNMDVWYLPLADITKDCVLLSVLNRIGPRSMLLLEDADVFHAATQRNENDNGVTLSGLLNALDGIATPHGLLTVLTTNTQDVLDYAVVRAGRVDLVEHFTHADADQVARLMARWYGQPVPAHAEIGNLSPAQVIEACKRHDNPSAAVVELANARPILGGRERFE